MNHVNELYEKIVQLKMTAEGGNRRLTDVANTKRFLRIIQSVGGAIYSAENIFRQFAERC